MSGNYVIGRLTEGQQRGTSSGGPPVGDAHAVAVGQGMDTLCGIVVLHIEEQQTFPPQGGSGDPPVCQRCLPRYWRV